MTIKQIYPGFLGTEKDLDAMFAKWAGWSEPARSFEVMRASVMTCAAVEQVGEEVARLHSKLDAVMHRIDETDARQIVRELRELVTPAPAPVAAERERVPAAAAAARTLAESTAPQAAAAPVKRAKKEPAADKDAAPAAAPAA